MVLVPSGRRRDKPVTRTRYFLRAEWLIGPEAAVWEHALTKHWIFLRWLFFFGWGQINLKGAHQVRLKRSDISMTYPIELFVFSASSLFSRITWQNCDVAMGLSASSLCDRDGYSQICTAAAGRKGRPRSLLSSASLCIQLRVSPNHRCALTCRTLTPLTRSASVLIWSNLLHQFACRICVYAYSLISTISSSPPFPH